MAKAKGSHLSTVSGPDVDRTAESVVIGLSLALTFAGRASKERREAAYHVRDAEGHSHYRVEALADGTVSAFTTNGKAPS